MAGYMTADCPRHAARARQGASRFTASDRSHAGTETARPLSLGRASAATRTASWWARCPVQRPPSPAGSVHPVRRQVGALVDRADRRAVQGGGSPDQSGRSVVGTARECALVQRRGGGPHQGPDRRHYPRHTGEKALKRRGWGPGARGAVSGEDSPCAAHGAPSGDVRDVRREWGRRVGGLSAEKWITSARAAFAYQCVPVGLSQCAFHKADELG